MFHSLTKTILSCATFLILGSLASLAENVINLEFYENRKGWDIVGSAKINSETPTIFDITNEKQVILSNGARKRRASYLTTKKLYQDHEIHAEFMIPKNSNSGFYVLGRYEVQIFDSFGVTQLTPSDMGGIYERWDTKRTKKGLPNGYEGTSPLTNAANRFGEWQSLTIKFRAPRFNKYGTKISHARFLEITLNDKLIHKGVNAKGPTRANPLKGERNKGPLIIQGDHGPIAIRKLEIYERNYSDIQQPKLSEQESTPLGADSQPLLDLVKLGRELYTSKSCIECHAYEAKTDAVKTGPNLFGVFQKQAITHNIVDGAEKHITEIRANENYLKRSLRSPTDHLALEAGDGDGADKGKAYLPLMPPYNKKALSDHEIDAIYSYLLTLNEAKNAGAPTNYVAEQKKPTYNPDIDPQAIYTGAETKIVRAFVNNNTSARSVHVGLINGQNYSFDPKTLSIQSVWTGRFLDLRNEIKGRGGKANKLGLGAQKWSNGYSHILQPITLSGEPFDDTITNTIPEDAYQQTAAFQEQLQNIPGGFLGYKSSDPPTLMYSLDGNLVELQFSISPKGTMSATVKGELIRPLTLKFPASEFSSIKVKGGTLNKRQGTWTLTNLTSSASWTATPKTPHFSNQEAGAAIVTPSPFEWKESSRKEDLIEGFAISSASGPTYANGATPLFEPTGIDFDKNGIPIIGSRSAGIWKIIDKQWTPFALGTFEVLGVKVRDDGSLVVCQKPELSLISDSNNDGVANSYRTLSADYRFTGNYHAYNHGPAIDTKGNIHYNLNLQHHTKLYKAGGKHMGTTGGLRGWCCKVSAKGEFTPFAYGLRSSAGLEFSPDDQLYYTENQGEYVATSKLFRLDEGKYYGHPSGAIDLEGMNAKTVQAKIPQLAKTQELPSILLPHKMAMNSPGHPVWDTTDGKFGPFSGQAFLGDQTLSKIYRIYLEEINEVEQGALMPFVDDLPSGPMRLTFSPQGELWIGQTGRGWSSRGGDISALQKISWKGKVAQAIHRVEARTNGYEIYFTQPFQNKDLPSFSQTKIDSWYYANSSKYGSLELDQRNEEIQSMKWSRDNKSLSIQLKNFGYHPEKKTTAGATSRVYRLQLHETALGEQLSEFHTTAYYTLNIIPKSISGAPKF